MKNNSFNNSGWLDNSFTYLLKTFNDSSVYLIQVAILCMNNLELVDNKYLRSILILTGLGNGQ